MANTMANSMANSIATTDYNPTTLLPRFCIIMQFCQELTSPHLMSSFPLIEPLMSGCPGLIRQSGSDPLRFSSANCESVSDISTYIIINLQKKGTTELSTFLEESTKSTKASYASTLRHLIPTIEQRLYWPEALQKHENDQGISKF